LIAVAISQCFDFSNSYAVNDFTRARYRAKLAIFKHSDKKYAKNQAPDVKKQYFLILENIAF